ncbi:MAG: GntR family transcriptional regulator [Lachnospiraceae bacterium]|nr:GntR family transcriptional regulator [Lachnospiraceae bacterium]
MIWIDYKDSTPIYEQIVNRFKNLIVRGILKADDKMPSVRNLAIELSINPNTIQKAYMMLEQQGFIYTVKGRGNFVAAGSELMDIKKREIIDKLEAVANEAKEAGLDIRKLVDEMLNNKEGERV